MEEWLKKHFNKILSSSLAVVLFLISILGWFLNRTVNEYDKRFDDNIALIQQEISERKNGDDDLELRLIEIQREVDNKISYKEFEKMDNNIIIIQDDIKYILKVMPKKGN